MLFLYMCTHLTNGAGDTLFPPHFRTHSITKAIAMMLTTTPTMITTTDTPTNPDTMKLKDLVSRLFCLVLDVAILVVLNSAMVLIFPDSAVVLVPLVLESVEVLVVLDSVEVPVVQGSTVVFVVDSTA